MKRPRGIPFRPSVVRGPGFYVWEETLAEARAWGDFLAQVARHDCGNARPAAAGPTPPADDGEARGDR